MTRLFTPGPLNTTATVKQCMQFDVGSRTRGFVDVVHKVRESLLAVVGAAEPEHVCVLLQGSGTFAIEATIGTAMSSEHRLLACSNGSYGERIAYIARARGVGVEILRVEETVPITADAVDKRLAQDPSVTHLSIVHCETSTGLINPVADIARVAKEHGCTVIVDAMSSFGGVLVDLPRSGIDYLISSPNKCLQGVPGFAFVLARRPALVARRGLSSSVCLDLVAQLDEFDVSGQFRFTPPTHTLLAAEQALQEFNAEGAVAGRADRYRANHQRLMVRMTGLGFRPLLETCYQSPIITAFHWPAQRAFAPFCDALADRGFVIYPGKIAATSSFRIGTIGDLCVKDVDALTDAIDRVLTEQGWRP